VFTLIFVSLFVTGWLVLGFLPWLAWSVATRGNAGLANLPFCLFAAVVAGLAVPILIRDDGLGLWLSAGAALAASFALLLARRLSVEAPNAEVLRREDRERAD